MPLTKQQIAELDRRIKEADSGKSKWVSGEKVKARLDALQAKWRAKADAEVKASRIDWSHSPRKGFVSAEHVLDAIRDAFSRQTRPAKRKKRAAKASPKLK